MKRAAIATLIVLSGPGRGLAQSCDEFRYQRNRICKEAGYCFKTADAI